MSSSSLYLVLVTRLNLRRNTASTYNERNPNWLNGELYVAKLRLTISSDKRVRTGEVLLRSHGIPGNWNSVSISSSDMYTQMYWTIKRHSFKKRFDTSLGWHNLMDFLTFELLTWGVTHYKKPSQSQRWYRSVLSLKEFNPSYTTPNILSCFQNTALILNWPFHRYWVCVLVSFVWCQYTDMQYEIRMSPC